MRGLFRLTSETGRATDVFCNVVARPDTITLRMEDNWRGTGLSGPGRIRRPNRELAKGLEPPTT